MTAPLTLAGTILPCPSCGQKVNLPKIRNTESSLNSSDDLDRRTRLLKAMQEAIAVAGKQQLESITHKDLARRGQIKKLLAIIEQACGDTRSYDKTKAARKAIQEIVSLQSVSGGEGLLQRLSSLSDRIRPDAIQAIAKLRTPGAFEPIVRLLLSSSTDDLVAAIQGLGELGDLAAIAPLLNLPALQPDQRIRVSLSIAKLGEQAVPQLIDVIQNSDEQDLRLIAVESLKALRSPTSIDVLMTVVQQDEGHLRNLAVETLAEIDHPKRQRFLVKMVKDPSSVIREIVISNLAKLQQKSCLPIFLSALQHDTVDVQKAAMKGIGLLGQDVEPATSETLIPFLKSTDSSLQLAAVNAAGKIGEQKLTPFILEILAETPTEEFDAEKLTTIIKSLQRLRDPRAVLPLCELLDSQPDEQMRRRLTEALGVIGDPAAKNALIKHLQRDESSEVRASSAQALGMLGDESATPLLVEALYDSPNVKIKALIALGKLKSPSLGSVIKEMLSDPLPSIRYQAVSILGELGDSTHATSLEPLVADPDEMVQRAALKALRASGETRSEKEILKTLKKSQKSTPSFHFLPPAVFDLFSKFPGGPITGVTAASLLLVGLVAVVFFSQSDASPAVAPVVRGYVGTISLTEDGKFAVVSRTRGMTETWNMESSERVWFGGEPPTARGLVACSRAETALLVAGKSVFFYVFSAEDGSLKKPQEQVAHQAGILQTACSANREFAVTFDSDGVVHIWDLKGRKNLGTLSLPAETAAVGINNLGTLIAGGGPRGVLRVWSIAGAEVVFDNSPSLSNEKVSGVTNSISFSSDSKMIAHSTTSGTLLISDLSAGRLHSRKEAGAGKIELDFTNDNHLVLVNSQVNRLVDLKRGEFEIIGESTPAWTTSSFCAESAILAMGSDEGKPISILEIQSGKVRELDTE